MAAFCCHGNQSFDPICPKTLCSLSPTPVMLRIKLDQDWPTGFRDIQVWKCWRRRTTVSWKCQWSMILKMNFKCYVNIKFILAKLKVFKGNFSKQIKTDKYPTLQFLLGQMSSKAIFHAGRANIRNGFSLYTPTKCPIRRNVLTTKWFSNKK